MEERDNIAKRVLVFQGRISQSVIELMTTSSLSTEKMNNITSSSSITNKVLSFWFRDSSSKFIDPKLVQFWFIGNKETDDLIRSSFLDEIEMISANTKSIRDDLIGSGPKGSLSAIIILDQFRRNVYRNSPAAFSHDHIALDMSKSLVRDNGHLKLDPIHRTFVYMPFQHSESIQDQLESLRLFKELKEETKELEISSMFSSFYEYAMDHHKTISRFSRFPTRNIILQRQSTEEETEFMQSSIKK